MYITKLTDYSLRTLMLLALQPKGELMSIEQISDTFNISRAHLMKVVHQLAKLDLVETVRGRSGGVRIHYDHNELNIGEVFRQLEEVTELVACSDGPCLFQSSCKLERALQKATNAFINELDQYTLADLVKQRSHLQKIVMHRAS
ncbi:MAG: Rrf2 family transcriptional regulator [Granulosicoccus sp.]